MWTITTDVLPIFFLRALLSTRRTSGLHFFSNSRRRICLEGMTWASLWTMQNISTDRIHIFSIWWENCCPKHDCTACLAFYFPSVQSTKAADTRSGAQGALSWRHVPALVVNLALWRTKMEGGWEHHHGLLLLTTPLVLTGAHTGQEAGTVCWLFAELCVRQQMGPRPTQSWSLGGNGHTADHCRPPQHRQPWGTLRA